MTWAMEQQAVTDSLARHVLLCLANYADNTGKAAFPSASTLATDTGMSERSVRNKLDLLEALGLIVKGNQAIVAAYIERGDRRPICYDMSMPRKEETRGARGAGRSPRGAAQVATGCTSYANGVQDVPERGAPGAGNPSFNPSINPSLNQNHGRAAALPDWLPAEEWEKFVKFRQTVSGKRKFTQHAEELLLEDLTALRAEGNDPVAVIKQSIKRGWAGLFKISGDRAQQTSAAAAGAHAPVRHLNNRDASRAAGAASIGLGAPTYDDESTVIDADFRRIA